MDVKTVTSRHDFFARTFELYYRSFLVFCFAYYQNLNFHLQLKKLLKVAPTGKYELANFCHYNTFGNSRFQARCDMCTDDGDWLVIPRRLPNGTTNFTRNWQVYDEDGFGDLEGEFW